MPLLTTSLPAFNSRTTQVAPEPVVSLTPRPMISDLAVTSGPRPFAQTMPAAPRQDQFTSDLGLPMNLAVPATNDLSFPGPMVDSGQLDTGEEPPLPYSPMDPEPVIAVTADSMRPTMGPITYPDPMAGDIRVDGTTAPDSGEELPQLLDVVPTRFDETYVAPPEVSDADYAAAYDSVDWEAQNAAAEAAAEEAEWDEAGGMDLFALDTSSRYVSTALSCESGSHSEQQADGSWLCVYDQGQVPIVPEPPGPEAEPPPKPAAQGPNWLAWAAIVVGAWWLIKR